MTVESPSAAIEPNVRSFLVTPVRYATIATVNRDGSPHQTVIWFVLRGDRIIVNSRRGRRWPANLERERRASLTVFEREDAVTLELELEDTYDGEQAQADIAALANRYDPPEAAEFAIARFRTQQRVGFVLAPRRIHVHGEPR